jgi:hypothetical protein
MTVGVNETGDQRFAGEIHHTRLGTDQRLNFSRTPDSFYFFTLDRYRLRDSIRRIHGEDGPVYVHDIGASGGRCLRRRDHRSRADHHGQQHQGPREEDTEVRSFHKEGKGR